MDNIVGTLEGFSLGESLGSEVVTEVGYFGVMSVGKDTCKL